MKYLIAGLGNIGPEYELTRHNIGFLVLDALAKKYDTTFHSSRYALSCEIRYKGRTLILIKPTTYMNLSGKAINYWLKENKLSLENILVITDDLALPYGKLRMRPKGSNGGHNGLGNIQEVLETDVYTRLRFGVGNEFQKGKQIDYVLSKFSGDELIQLPIFIDKAVEGILAFTTIGVEKAMNIVNKN